MGRPPPPPVRSGLLVLLENRLAGLHRGSLPPGDALVFGSESQGLPRSLLDGSPDRCLRIPMAAEARSLNLAVSVAVAAYEARRQCQHKRRVES